MLFVAKYLILSLVVGLGAALMARFIADRHRQNRDPAEYVAVFLAFTMFWPLLLLGCIVDALTGSDDR